MVVWFLADMHVKSQLFALSGPIENINEKAVNIVELNSYIQPAYIL